MLTTGCAFTKLQVENLACHTKGQTQAGGVPVLATEEHIWA